MMEQSEAREFALAFRSFLEWVHDDARDPKRNEVAALVIDLVGSLPPQRLGRAWMRAQARMHRIDM